jgi:preprotein translocase subunit SecF
MLYRPLLRIVPDGTRIPFMRGRILGLLVSAVLSVASLALAVRPGLNEGIDFAGGVAMEIRTDRPADLATLHGAVSALHLGEAGLQRFGDETSILLRLPAQGEGEGTQRAVAAVRGALEHVAPGSRIVRVEAVGGRASDELFRDGMTALGLALLAMLLYIWFRFEWQFGAGAVATLVLDTTKVVGFLALTRIEFSLVTVAAILTVIGYSVNDKVVVYDRVRENLRKYKTMPLRRLIDLSINETLNRTVGTSSTVLLAILPLALFARGALSDFALVVLFGIAVGTSSSIFIAAPVLLFLGEGRLRQGAPAPGRPLGLPGAGPANLGSGARASAPPP